jgi:hypothetical protein
MLILISPPVLVSVPIRVAIDPSPESEQRCSCSSSFRRPHFARKSAAAAESFFAHAQLIIGVSR